MHRSRAGRRHLQAAASAIHADRRNSSRMQTQRPRNHCLRTARLSRWVWVRVIPSKRDNDRDDLIQQTTDGSLACDEKPRSRCADISMLLLSPAKIATSEKEVPSQGRPVETTKSHAGLKYSTSERQHRGAYGGVNATAKRSAPKTPASTNSTITSY